MEEVPERFVPARMRGGLIEAEHLARYWWASQLASGRRVLDAGCGVGYGAALLHEAGAASTDGIDISAVTVDAARANVPDEVTLHVGDVTMLPFPDGAFDLVVCFEVIEHVPLRDAVLAELARVLAPGGVLALSSPNRDQYPPGNPHHVSEYTSEELRDALASRFREVAVHRQQAWTASAILDDAAFAADELGEPLALTSAKVSARMPGQETYSVALAGDGPLPRVDGRAVFSGAVELRRWLTLYDEQQAVLERQHAQLSGEWAHRAEQAVLHRRLRAVEQELAEVTVLRQRERDATRDLADTARKLDEARAERVDALAHAERAEARMEQAEARMEYADDRTAQAEARAERAEAIGRDLQASTSWLITRPARWIKRRLT